MLFDGCKYGGVLILYLYFCERRETERGIPLLQQRVFFIFGRGNPKSDCCN